MSDLEIRQEPLEGAQGVVVLHIEGALDQPTLSDFLGALEGARDAGRLRVLLNMEGVSYANSTALGALVTQADAFRDAGGELVLFAPQPKVELVIDMLGLGALFKVCATAEEAKEHITSAPATAAKPEAAAAAAPAPEAKPSGTAAFPLRAECIGCGIVLEFSQASHFRCPRCGTVYSVDATGRIAGSKTRGGQPIEVTLTCHPLSIQAFKAFVGGLPAWDGYDEAERQRLEQVVGEVCQVIRDEAYNGDDNATFHVLVLSRPDELALRLGDHGKPLDPSAFPLATDYMTEFEHRPHPTRGNLLKMAKRLEAGA